MEEGAAMKMTKLNPIDCITPSDFIKSRDSQKVVPVTVSAGYKVGELDIYMDEDFEGFYRGTAEAPCVLPA